MCGVNLDHVSHGQFLYKSEASVWLFYSSIQSATHSLGHDVTLFCDLIAIHRSSGPTRFRLWDSLKCFRAPLDAFVPNSEICQRTKRGKKLFHLRFFNFRCLAEYRAGATTNYWLGPRARATGEKEIYLHNLCNCLVNDNTRGSH